MITNNLGLGRGSLALFLGVVLLLTNSGCANMFQSVAAYRKYVNEDPNGALVADRADDVLTTIRLVDYMLTQKPYPGDGWVERLPLDDARADRIRADIRNDRNSPYASPASFEIPIVKLYRVHLTNELKPPPDALHAAPPPPPAVPPPPPPPPPPSPPPPRPTRPYQRPPQTYPPHYRPHRSSNETASNLLLAQIIAPAPAESGDAGTTPSDSIEDAGAPPSPPAPPAPPVTEPTAVIPPAPPEISRPIFEALAGSGALKTAWQEYVETSKRVTAAHAMVEQWEAIYAGSRGGREPWELTQARALLDQARSSRDKAKGKVESEIDGLSVTGASDPTARDAAVILSTALRADLEALAMVPTIAFQSIEVLRSGRDVATAVGSLSQLAWQVKPTKQALEQDVEILDKLVKKLGKQINQSKDDMAGYQLKDSLVDDITGITLDWIHLRANAGLDMMIFSPASVGEQSNDSKKTYDYTGRLRKAEYEIQPIVLANASIAIGFDTFRLPEVGKVSLGYKTDRQWKSGGNIQSGSLGSQLGFDRRTSDLIDLGLQLTGARSNVKIATFDAGDFKYENATSGALLAEAPFRVQYTQVDVGWDFAWLIRDPRINTAYVGFRYLDYRLPRLLYELENQAPPKAEQAQYTYFNESAPQQTTSRYYLGGVELEADLNDRGVFVPYALLAFYGGGGPVSFLMKRVKAVECPVGATTPGCVSYNNPAETNRVNDNAIALVGSFGAGFRIRAYAGRRFSFYGEASYRLDLIYAETSLGEAENGKEHTVDFGGPDLMHTLHAGLNLNF